MFSARETGDARELDERQAQKLQAVGSLAAGIAHEMSTPIQFVGDSTRFLRTAFDSMVALCRRYDELMAAGVSGEALARAVEEAKGTADLAYLEERVPRALDRAANGLERLAAIVRAMKEFSHPDQREKTAADLNQAVDNAVLVSRPEWKHVAELRFDRGELPLVPCHVGDLQHAIMNLLVNAAHAIADARRPGGRGNIHVRTYVDGDDVVISVGDDGTGIPADIHDRIFDPFFTTKELGRGTGQGLAITRAIVVERHGGRITFTTALGEGSTFRVRVPISPAGR